MINFPYRSYEKILFSKETTYPIFHSLSNVDVINFSSLTLLCNILREVKSDKGSLIDRGETVSLSY